MVSPRAYPGRLPYFGAPVEHARWILGSKKEAGPSLKVLDSWVSRPRNRQCSGPLA